MVRAGFLVVLTVALADGVFGSRGVLENMQLRSRNAALAASIEALDADNAALIDEVRRLREDPAAIEELARGELELMKDGELLVILRDAPPSTASPRAAAAMPLGR
jgi:cell division protein FtsB